MKGGCAIAPRVRTSIVGALLCPRRGHVDGGGGLCAPTLDHEGRVCNGSQHRTMCAIAPHIGQSIVGVLLPPTCYRRCWVCCCFPRWTSVCEAGASCKRLRVSVVWLLSLSSFMLLCRTFPNIGRQVCALAPCSRWAPCHTAICDVRRDSQPNVCKSPPTLPISSRAMPCLRGITVDCHPDAFPCLRAYHDVGKDCLWWDIQYLHQALCNDAGEKRNWKDWYRSTAEMLQKGGFRGAKSPNALRMGREPFACTCALALEVLLGISSIRRARFLLRSDTDVRMHGKHNHVACLAVLVVRDYRRC